MTNLWHRPRKLGSHHRLLGAAIRMWNARPTIEGHIKLVGAMFAALSLIFVAASWTQAREVQTILRGHETLAKLDSEVQRLDHIVSEFRLNARDLVESGNSGSKIMDRQIALFAAVSDVSAQIATLTSLDDKMVQSLDPFATERDITECAELTMHIDARSSPVQRQQVLAQVRKRTLEIDERVTRLANIVRAKYRASQNQSQLAIRWAFAAIICTALFNLITGVLLSRYLVRTIAHPARRIAWATQCLAQGNLEVAVPDMHMEELRQIGTSLEAFRETTIAERTHAYQDMVSGLPNRRSFMADLERHLQQSGQIGFALMLVDIDRFKDINDTYGHDDGDALIRAVGSKIQNSLPFARVGRLGGDEFGVILPFHEESQVRKAGALLSEAMREPFHLGDYSLVATGSIGCAIVIGRTPDIATVMREADAALYHAKAAGRDQYAIFAASMAEENSISIRLKCDLPQAIATDRLRLAYQPIMPANGAHIPEVEALVRWNHPELGEVSPLRFIPVAEKAGLIVPLGNWIIRRAFADLRHWPDMRMSINLSPLQLRTEGFAHTVLSLAQEYAIAPARIEFEITESVAIECSERANLTLALLRSFGFRIALDDFGSGYSSLSLLKTYPIDRLKLDRSLLLGFDEDAAGAAVLRAAVAIGTCLELEIVAEGIETAVQANAMRAAGCTHLQGYHFSPPLEVAQVESYFSAPAHNSPAAARNRAA